MVALPQDPEGRFPLAWGTFRVISCTAAVARLPEASGGRPRSPGRRTPESRSPSPCSRTDVMSEIECRFAYRRAVTSTHSLNSASRVHPRTFVAKAAHQPPRLMVPATIEQLPLSDRVPSGEKNLHWPQVLPSCP